MAWSFGDSFDLYTAVADMTNGYWDSGSAASVGFVAGRFTGSQCMRVTGSTFNLTKSSGVNDALHHIVVSFLTATAISGSTLGTYFQLLDGTTGQCCIVFRSDGAILLTSGTAAGTVLATYSGAFPVINTWYAFEIEVLISNTAGYMNVRKNGNTVNDFSSATNLNTRVSANNYANKLTIANQAGNSQSFDDLFWRSDASSVAWMGDIRCYTRMPASDQSVQFSRTPTTSTVTPNTAGTTISIVAGSGQYTQFTATYDGTISTVTVTLTAGYTGNMKCSMFTFISSTSVGAVLGSANVLTNPATGVNTITFGTPFPVTRGTTYWIGMNSDTSSGTWSVTATANGRSSTTSYASFPVASPVTSASNGLVCSLVITVAGNYATANEAQQDTTTSYVYDSTPGHADFYGVASIASTPVATIALTTRGYMEKSDAGTRTAAVQLKSGGATVASPTLVLTTSGWQWAWRTDITDPNTSAAWTAAAVNNAQIGPTVVA